MTLTAHPVTSLIRPNRPVTLGDVQTYVDPADGQTLLVTPRAAAQLVGVTPRTVYLWIARGLVEVRRTPIGRLRVVVSSLTRASRAESTQQESR